MKAKFLLLFSICVTVFISGQIGKFTAYSFSSKYKSGSTWTDWDSHQEVNILTSINFDDKKIKIYSKETQIYDIITIDDKVVDEEGDDIYRMYCEDRNGSNCYVDIYVLNSQGGRMQIYIRYTDMQWVYNLERTN